MTEDEPNFEPKLTCRELVEILADYLEGSLPEEQFEVLQRHLNLCPPCLDYLDTYRSTIILARECVPKPQQCDAREECPEELIQAIMNARREMRHAPRRDAE
ncbi:MAG: zf-HC2 domain-containing protein [Planctomycetes bacterium]|nr:zf-HC2 domain-containing protein [Planctomycetota bacterium]